MKNLAIVNSDRDLKNRINFSHTPLRYLKSLSPGEIKRIQISSLSHFGDNDWDFSEEDTNRPRHELALSFTNIFPSNTDFAQVSNAELLFSLKCLAHSMLTDPPTSRYTKPGIIKNFHRGGLKNLIAYMVEEGFYAFSQLTPTHFQEFLIIQVSKVNSFGEITDRTLRNRVRGIEWITLQSEKLDDKLSFNPWDEFGTHGKWAIANANIVVNREVLTTSPISDELVKKLIAGALGVVDEAPRLIHALTKLRKDNKTLSGFKRDSSLQSAPDYLSDFPNETLLSSLGFKDTFEVRRFYCVFRGAVGVLIGLLSGMRPAEIFAIPGSIKHACKVEPITVKDLEVKCQFIRSTLTKNQPVPNEKIWQTIPIVIAAMATLAEINQVCLGIESKWLFRSAKARTRFGNDHTARRLKTSILNDDIQRLIEYLDLESHVLKAPLNGRMLRRTFARIITRNGLGIVELQEQLKHYDPDVTRMYGEPKLNENFDNEKTSYSQELYEELLAGTFPIIGGGASIVEGLRIKFTGLTRPDRNRFLRALPKAALIDQVDLGLCLYKADQALCGGDKVNCKPAQCLNSVIPLDTAIRSLRNRKKENMRLIKLLKDPAKQSYLFTQQKTIDLLLEQAEIKTSKMEVFSEQGET